VCGRYAIYGPVSRTTRDTIEFLDEEIEFSPRYNAAPTQLLPVYRVHPEHGSGLALLRWGLVPSWAKDAAIGARMINARAETAAEKPSFRAAFKRRRCLVPMAGFYEWQKTPERKVPHFIRLLNAELFAAAGLYEYWPGKEGAEPIESYTILTTEANAMMRRLHERMPVLLHETDYDAWLDPKNEDSAALKKLLKPYPADEMRAHPISTRVNNVRNNGPEIIEAVA
jgi:putative SOS response-associated peptidase YedK